MKTYLFEARHGADRPGNWGKFMVGVPDEEWAWRSEVDVRGTALLSAIGWTGRHIWVCDLQTGEGAYIRPGGSAHADLEKHRIWVCPLFEPWLEWLYRQDMARLDELPRVIDLPDAEFAFAGYRRPGGLAEGLAAERQRALARVAEIDDILADDGGTVQAG